MLSQLPTVSEVRIRGFEELATSLSGQVLHVTTIPCFENIRAVGAIQPNTEGLASPFGNSTNGYFRLKGCVSLFDYRAFGTNDWEEHAYKCLPTMPLETHSALVFLFLDAGEFIKLISWIRWKEEEAWSQRVVPHVEVGYPGALALQFIKSVLRVSLVPR
jgi:hypothetical protein